MEKLKWTFKWILCILLIVIALILSFVATIYHYIIYKPIFWIFSKTISRIDLSAIFMFILKCVFDLLTGIANKLYSWVNTLVKRN